MPLMGLVSPMSGIHRRYNNYGYRTDLIDLASGDLLHQVVERDNWGNITKEIRGNGYSTYYTYDKYFGRLKHQYADNGASDQFRIQDIAYEWDAVGNLKSRHNQRDRKSTRLNSSHVAISYAVFCLKKKT